MSLQARKPRRADNSRKQWRKRLRSEKTPNKTVSCFFRKRGLRVRFGGVGVLLKNTPPNAWSVTGCNI